MVKRTYFLAFVAALAFAMLGSYGCSKNENAQDANAKSDGSTVETHVAADGTKTEVRTFESGEVFRVSRISKPDGERLTLYDFRDNRTALSHDDSDFDNAMDATGDAITASAKRTWEVSNNIGSSAVSVSKNVAEKSSDTSKDVVDKGIETGKDVGEAVGDTSVKVGKTVGKTSAKVGKTVGSEAKKTAKKIKNVFN